MVFRFVDLSRILVEYIRFSFYLDKVIWNELSILNTYNCKYLYIKMEAFVNVIRIDPKVRNKINDMLDRYNRLPSIYQSKMG